MGLGFIAGACALAWLSSLDVMTVTRASATSADVAFEVLRKSDEGRELLRFLFAQACVLLLALVGWFVLRLGLRAMFPSPNEGIGPV